MRPHRALRPLLALLVFAAGGCRGATDPDPLVGTWLATTFEITSAGQGRTNVLASGGTLGLNVASNFVTTGTLIVPAALNGGTTFTASLAGTATRTNNVVHFDQPADTFMRNLTFTLVENRLEATAQVVGTATYDVILTRQ